jgi:hypothetical protein
MSKTKWTNGPWRVGFGYGVTVDYMTSVVTGDKIICELPKSVSPSDKDRHNLILIAAAPELYEALLMVTKSTEYSCMVNEERDQIQAALEKARGE